MSATRPSGPNSSRRHNNASLHRTCPATARAYPLKTANTGWISLRVRSKRLRSDSKGSRCAFDGCASVRVLRKPVRPALIVTHGGTQSFWMVCRFKRGAPPPNLGAAMGGPQDPRIVTMIRGFFLRVYDAFDTDEDSRHDVGSAGGDGRGCNERDVRRGGRDGGYRCDPQTSRRWACTRIVPKWAPANPCRRALRFRICANPGTGHFDARENRKSSTVCSWLSSPSKSIEIPDESRRSTTSRTQNSDRSER